MKKIGIITLSGNYNYGNRLQNYAMQEVYKKLGFEAETIWNKMCSDNKTKFPILVRLKNEIKPMIGRTNYVKMLIQEEEILKILQTHILKIVTILLKMIMIIVNLMKCMIIFLLVVTKYGITHLDLCLLLTF